ncbi:pyruvate kinase [Candidatus Peregrinibacteria bacterium CG10_big_fil_rev_8_21_14_0_10_55_24]|nr:MAG: pyruvate kinase [Candidatus Peregrinibacteria bacterium CG10_big_fil_rev_8_21_14_0_10_55_24]
MKTKTCYTPLAMRLTKIVCTIGPACRSAQTLKALCDAGMTVARLNLSHGTQDDCKTIIEDIRKINQDYGYAVAIMFDTKGAEIRTGVVQYPIEITKGQEVVFSPHPLDNEERTVITVNYDRFYADVPETDRILIDNGEMALDIVDIRADGSVVARSQDDGSIGSRRHINLPGADIDLPSITEKDWEDIAFTCEQKADFVALSFIRNAGEVQSVRTFLEERGSPMQIITKVETRQAVENIAEIIDVSDAIMVARGDLGADLPFEELPIIQDDIVLRCRDRGTPVIVATHMLESMTEHPMPTRAEVTDVAYAVMTGADATMLSGETASGKFPIRAVEAMARIQQRTEEHIARFSRRAEPVHDEREGRSEAAVSLAQASKAVAIVAFTKTGRTVLEISKFRPSLPIIACTNTPERQRSLQLAYGVLPLCVPFADPETTVQNGFSCAKERGFLHDGDSVVILSDIPISDSGFAPSVQVRTL